MACMILSLGGGWLGDVGAAELDSFHKLLALGVLCDDREATVVMGPSLSRKSQDPRLLGLT